MIFGGYRTVWLITMFDLPVKTPSDRSAYADFRKLLLVNGFVMLQYSVYARHCPSEDNSMVHENRIRRMLPATGEVRLLSVTDKQFGRMKVFAGQKPRKNKRAPEQITLL